VATVIKYSIDPDVPSCTHHWKATPANGLLFLAFGGGWE